MQDMVVGAPVAKADAAVAAAQSAALTDAATGLAATVAGLAAAPLPAAAIATAASPAWADSDLGPQSLFLCGRRDCGVADSLIVQQLLLHDFLGQ